MIGSLVEVAGAYLRHSFSDVPAAIVDGAMLLCENGAVPSRNGVTKILDGCFDLAATVLRRDNGTPESMVRGLRDGTLGWIKVDCDGASS